MAGPQSDAYYSQADITFYGGAAGGGKGQALSGVAAYRKYCRINSSLSYEEFKMQYAGYVYTPFGPKLIDDVCVGDVVSCPDGTTSKIITLSPTQERPCYRLTFDDGANVVVSDDHLWPVKLSGKRTRRKVEDPYPLDGMTGEQRFGNEILKRYKTMTTLDFIAAFDAASLQKEEGKRPHWPSIPTTEPVKFTRAPGRLIKMPPYTLGVMIGDGCLRRITPTWTKPDLVIGGYVQEELTAAGFTDSVHQLDAEQGSHSIVGQQVRQALVSCKLMGCLANAKFIPEYYKHAPVAERYALIQGLMDTDGTSDRRGQSYYSTASEVLAKDMQYVIRSLGYTCTHTVKEKPVYTYKGEKLVGQPSHQLYISGRNRRELFKLPRKKNRVTELNNEGGRRLISYTLVGNMDYKCIGLDHPLHLYLTNDFLVTHNTDLACGLACNGDHERVLILRREGTQLLAIVDRIEDIMGDRKGYNGQSKVWKTPTGGTIQLAGVPHESDKRKYQGQGHSLKVFDEVTEFTESQFRFIINWKRSSKVEEPQRILCTFNPPTTVAGRWVLRMIDPWINKNHPDPAEPGELRWYTTINSVEQRVDGAGPFIIDGAEIFGVSRTYIPAKVQDNVYYMASGYMTTLQALPEPLRSQMLHGDMSAGMTDDDFQVCPSAWVEAAMSRWKPRINKGVMSSMGVDVARGGRDKTIIVCKYEPLDATKDAYNTPTHGPWYDEIIRYPGESTPDGAIVASHVIRERRDAAPVHLDIVGVGSSPYDILVTNGIQTVGISGGTRQGGVTLEGGLAFADYKSELWWRARESLSPVIGNNPEIPPDDELREDLCAMTWKMTSRGIKVSTKDEVKEVLGRSPDTGDGFVYAGVDTMKTAELERMYESVSDFDDPDPYSDAALGL